MSDSMGYDVERRVRERAYFLWLQEGRPEGRAAEHWLRACEAEGLAAAPSGRREAQGWRIDEQSEQSFPASDPPSHISLTGARLGRRR